MSDYDLNKDQTEKLEEFRKRIGDVLSHLPSEKGEDWQLVRWLHARGFDLDKAEEMFRTSMKWRLDNSVDKILQEWTPPPILKQYWSSGVHRTSKEGFPVYYETLANIDFLGMAKATSKEDVIKYCIYQCEKMDLRLEELSKEKGTRISRIIMIQNMDNIRNFPLGNEFMSLYRDVMRVMTDNYPERLHKCYVINLPAARIFAIGWSLVKFVFDERMRNKINFLYGEWQEEVFKIIERDDFPAFLGGNCYDPDAECSNNIGKGGRVPESLFKNYLNKLTVEISRGSKFKEHLTVEVEGASIKYDFITKDNDIKFGIFIENDKGKLENVLEMKRYDNCHKENVVGKLKAKPGKYILEWDNNYSYFRSKTLLYSIEIELPMEELNAALAESQLA